MYTWCYAPFPRAGPEIINPYGAATERHGFLNSVTLAEGSSEQTQSRPAECQFFQIGKSPKKPGPSAPPARLPDSAWCRWWLADIISCTFRPKTLLECFLSYFLPSAHRGEDLSPMCALGSKGGMFPRCAALSESPSVTLTQSGESAPHW